MAACPKCKSKNVDKLNYGKRAGATIGGLGGVASGATTALGGAATGAQAGATVGAVSGNLKLYQKWQ